MDFPTKLAAEGQPTDKFVNPLSARKGISGVLAPQGVTANIGYSDGKTITFQQCSDRRVLTYVYNRLTIC